MTDNVNVLNILNTITLDEKSDEEVWEVVIINMSFTNQSHRQL